VSTFQLLKPLGTTGISHVIFPLKQRIRMDYRQAWGPLTVAGGRSAEGDGGFEAQGVALCERFTLRRIEIAFHFDMRETEATFDA
jgi:hypothetical protein